MKELFRAERRNTRDRRTHARATASGVFQLLVDEPVPAAVAADLIESSATGFRAVHDSSLLEPGLVVEYRGAAMSGRARVVWTHILQSRRVSGFILLS